MNQDHSDLMLVKASFVDAFDALDRVLRDLRRSGCTLRSLELRSGAEPMIALSAQAPCGTDPARVAAGLRRHPSVVGPTVEFMSRGRGTHRPAHAGPGPSGLRPDRRTDRSEPDIEGSTAGLAGRLTDQSSHVSQIIA